MILIILFEFAWQINVSLKLLRTEQYIVSAVSVMLDMILCRHCSTVVACGSFSSGKRSDKILAGVRNPVDYILWYTVGTFFADLINNKY